MWKLAGMYNDGNKDLNRDFSIWIDYQRFFNDEDFDRFEGGRQTETLSMIARSVSPFDLSANLCDEAVLVFIPICPFRRRRAAQATLNA